MALRPFIRVAASTNSDLQSAGFYWVDEPISIIRRLMATLRRSAIELALPCFPQLNAALELTRRLGHSVRAWALFALLAASNAADDGEALRNLFALKRLDARKAEDHFEKRLKT